MLKGPQKISVNDRDLVTVKCDQEFTVYGLVKGRREFILGPLQSTARILHYRLPTGVNQVEVKTAKSTNISVDIEPWVNPKEIPDDTPIEITVEKPLTLQEEMRRFIREEVSRVAQSEGEPTFEEEDDFEIEDEEKFDSPYTITEMQEEYLGEELNGEPVPPETHREASTEPEKTTEISEENLPPVAEKSVNP